MLQGALGDTGGMAGSDPAGVRWGSSYRAALVQISGVTQDVINGVYTLAGLLVTTGFNHGLANSASEPGGTHDVVDHEDYGGDSVGLGGFQTASGSAGSDEPTGWQLVVSAVGYVWPNGHQDKLRAAAAAWSKGAQAVTTAGYLVPSAVGAIDGQQSPEVPDAVAACNAMGNHLAELSAAYNSMSTACTDYAGYIDAAHSDAIGELRSLLEWTAGIEMAGQVAETISNVASKGTRSGCRHPRHDARAVDHARADRGQVQARRRLRDHRATRCGRLRRVHEGGRRPGNRSGDDEGSGNLPGPAGRAELRPGHEARRRRVTGRRLRQRLEDDRRATAESRRTREPGRWLS